MGWSIKMMRHYIVTLFILLHMQGIVHLCQPPCLYAENGISVFRLDISKNDSTKYDKHEIIKKTDGTIMAIEIDYENDNIFWSDGHHYLINKTRLDGSNETVLHNVAIGLASSMSVDASSGTLYWLDFLTQHIEMSSSHGEFRNVLLKFSGKDTTIAFIVEPRNGYLFWSILGDHSRIERSNLAGGNRTVIAREKDIHFPTAFVIDYQNNRLMWLEHWLGKIMSVKIDGSDIRMEHELKHDYFGIRRRPYFYGLSYLSATKTFYVTEFVTNALYAVYLNAANETVVKMIYKERNEGALVAGMKIHEEFSLNILNPCRSNSCNQLCLRLSNTEYTCKCTVGYVLQTDGISCENANAKLEVLFADSEKQRLYHIKTFGNESGITLNEVPVPTNHTHFYPEALTFDQRLQYIYWTDLKVSKTFRIKKDGSGFENVNVTHNSGRASRGLAIASKSQVLFWFSGSTLKMSSISGNFEKTILTSDVYNPRDIVVHEGKGLLFFADQAQRRIVRIHLSSGKTDYFRITREFAQRRGGYTYYYTKATGLAIDYAEDRLYFCDDQSKTLESVKLDFSHHKVVFHETYYINGNFIVQPERSEVVQPFSIAIWKDEVFWTDLYHEAIFRANKRTGTHIEYVTGGLKSPKDIFVHGNYLSEDKKILYKISYHKKDADSSMCYKDDDGCKGKNDELEDPSTCPEGYKQSNFSSYCGKCSDTIGLRFVCPCINWETCAQRHETDVQGCLPSSPYMFFKIRECIQVIKPGYCPYNVSCSSNSTDDATCFSDNDCSQNKKCCKANCGREKCVDSLKQSDHPCLNNNGGCSHFCMALSENYYCDCPDGMQINKTNQLKCQEIPPPTCPAPCLYAANESMLFRIPLNSTSGLTLTENGEPQKVFPTFGFISSVEVDPVNQRLYWADIVHQTLNSSDLDGKDVSTLFSRNIGLIKSISVDSSSKLIYWVDGLLNTVEVASTEGMFRKVLYHYNYGDYIVAIVVDAVNGYLFLSVWGDTPRIERANLDGSNKMMFLDTDIHFPSDLSIDSKNGRLYWFDLVKNRIESISLNGTDRKTEIHVSETDLKPNYVAYSHTMKTAYFWHHQKHLMNSIFALNQTKSATSIYSQRMYFSYILHSTVAEVSLHEDINLNVAAPCLNAENKCSQLCLKINDLESTCACATGFEVDPTNNANCLPVESDYQVLVGNSQSNGFDLLNFYSNQSGLTVTNVMFENKTSATDIDYDRVTGNIFWIDSKSQRILRSSLKDLKPETIVEKVNADDMFVDEISNLLALKVGDYVYLHTLEGKSPIKLPIQLPTRHFLSIPVPYNNNPVFLLFNGMLYFSLPYGYGSITRLDLFTFETKMIRGTSGNNIHINTMVACNIKRKIYYLDSMSRTLQSFDLDLTNRRIIKRVNMQMPLSMDIYNERIYWTDSAALFSIDISGSENPQVLSNGLKGYKLPFKILANETRYTEYDTIYRFSTIQENNCFRSCATIKIAFNDPEECPSGYEQQGDVKFTCRNCTDKVDGRYVCPCRDKQTCAQRVSNEINGCMSKETPNLVFKTRECRKTIKPGFCPYNESANDCEKLDSCVSDNNCPENEKCCLSGCATKKCQKPNLVLDNPCYKNTCSHLCVIKDTGYKCLCPENMKLDASNTRCINKTEEESVCSIQPIVAACKTDRNNHYFFNTTSHQCEQIVYPICARKENNFESKGDCMNRCQGTKDICSFEKDHGPCQSFAPITKWYFDDDKKKCSTFSYGGCPGNKNNFESEKQCNAVCSGVCPVNDLIGPCVVNPEKTCQEDSDCDGRMLCCSVGCGKECIMPVSPVVKTTQRPSPTTPENVCQLEKEPGPCRSSYQRWFYNAEKGQCETFIYGGCQGNANNFETKEKCDAKCQGICLLPKDSGPCEAATDKWFFNSRSNQCEQFIYGGCQGNENRFNTKTDCQKKCQVRFTTLPPTYTSPTTSSHSTSQTTQTFSSPTTVSSVNVTTTSSPTTTTTTSTLATTTTTTSTMATTTGTLATTTTATTSTIATTSKATTTPITTTVTTIEETSPSTTTASETSTVAMTTTPLPLTTLSSSSVPSISTTGSTICTSATSSEGCVCPDNTGGEDCSLRGEDESITVELKVNDGEKKVSKAEVQAELAKALNDGCRQIDCTTKSVAVKRRKRRATGDNLEIRPEDVHIISFKQDGKSVFVVLFARLKDNRLISRDSLMKIFDSFPKSFGKSIGLEYVGYTNVQAENIKDKDKKSKLPIVLGVIGVILLICVAAIFLWKKKGLCKKPLTGPVMKWSNNNENYNNLDAQAQDNTPAVEGFVNPVYATNELGDQALGAQAQPIPVDNVQPIEKKEHVDISDYVQPKDEKIPISDFIEADLSKSIPGVDNPYFPTDPYSVLAGIKPPEYSSRPNTAQVGRYELPPYMSRVDIRQDEVSGDDLQKEILSALDASYAKDKQNADKKPDSTDNRTYSTVSLKDSGNFDTPFLPSEEVPNARSVSSVSLRDSGRFDTPFLPGDDIVPPAINSSVASVRSITVGEHAPEETPGRPSTVIEVQNSNTDC